MRTEGNARTHPGRRYYQQKTNDKTMDTYNTIDEIRKLKTCRAVRAYYKSLPRELQESPAVLREVRRKRKEIRWIRFYQRWFSR